MIRFDRVDDQMNKEREIRNKQYKEALLRQERHQADEAAHDAAGRAADPSAESTAVTAVLEKQRSDHDTAGEAADPPAESTAVTDVLEKRRSERHLDARIYFEDGRVESLQEFRLHSLTHDPLVNRALDWSFSQGMPKNQILLPMLCVFS